MGISFEWTDKQDNMDIVEAAHVNALASAINAMKDRVIGGVLEVVATETEGVYTCTKPGYSPAEGDILVLHHPSGLYPVPDFPYTSIILNGETELAATTIFKNSFVAPMLNHVQEEPICYSICTVLKLSPSDPFILFVHADTSSLFPTISVTGRVPTAADDKNYGQFVGSLWIDTSALTSADLYICVSSGTSGNAVWLPISSGGGGDEPLIENITYASLMTHITGDTLIPGKKYCITDFQTVHKIVTANETYAPVDNIHIGAIEPLIVQAITPGRLDIKARSLTYPKDIIHYEPLFTEELAKDYSFSDKTDYATPGTILSGFKGAITFRQDTVNNITCYFDFRNCVQRRWQADVAEFDSEATYFQGDWVFYNGTLYYAVLEPTTNTAPQFNSAWTAIIYSLNKCFLPVSEGEEWLGITATSTYTDYNVFDFDEAYRVANIHIARNFSAEAAAAVFIGACYDIEIGSFSAFNWLQDASSIKLGANSPSNIIAGSSCIDTKEFYNNMVGPYSNYNSFMSETYENIIGSGFKENIVHGAFNNNTINSDCTQNTFLGEFNYCTVGKSFQRNTIQAGVSEDLGGLALEAVEPLHSYYNVNLFQNSDGDVCISYVNASDQFIVYNITDAS